MKDRREFYNLLVEINGKPFAEYTRIIGDFDFARYIIKFTQIDTACDAESPVVNIRVPQSIAEIPAHLYDSPIRRIALEDYLARRVSSLSEQIARFDESGWARRNILLPSPGQKVLPRTSVLVTKEYIDVRVQIALPYKTFSEGTENRLIDAAMARKVFFEDLPEVIGNSVFCCNFDLAEVEHFVCNMEDSDCIRQMLETMGFVGFVGEGAFLTRQQNSDEPDFDQIVPFEVDASVEATIEVPNAGEIKGLGIPTGLTLIVGAASSGRKDFMNAISSGVYNHIPGDGREHVVTVSDAVQVASDYGRSVQEVNITPFITETDGSDPSSYSTRSADAFVSQAAATIEALEVGVRVLVFDENSSTSTFLTTDSRVASLLGDTSRVSLAQRARQMVDELGISLVIGGENLVAEYIPIADTVLKVEDFQVANITEEAKALNLAPPAAAPVVNLSSMISRSRWVMPSSVDATVGNKNQVIEAIDLKIIRFGRSMIDLTRVLQITEKSQTRALGWLLYYAKLRYMQEGYPLRKMLDLIDRDLSKEGVGIVSHDLRGDLARPRRYELAAALNRLPSFRVSHTTE